VFPETLRRGPEAITCLKGREMRGIADPGESHETVQVVEVASRLVPSSYV